MKSVIICSLADNLVFASCNCFAKASLALFNSVISASFCGIWACNSWILALKSVIICSLRALTLSNSSFKDAFSCSNFASSSSFALIVLESSVAFFLSGIFVLLSWESLSFNELMLSWARLYLLVAVESSSSNLSFVLSKEALSIRVTFSVSFNSLSLFLCLVILSLKDWASDWARLTCFLSSISCNAFSPKEPCKRDNSSSNGFSFSLAVLSSEFFLEKPFSKDAFCFNNSPTCVVSSLFSFKREDKRNVS